MPILAGYLVPHPPVIVPAVGGGREKEIRATADSYRRVAGEIAALRPDTIVIFSPHGTLYADYIHVSPGEGAGGDLSQFGAPETTEVRYDRELTEALSRLCEEEGFPAGTEGERQPALDHGVLVPLHFIREEYDGFRMVRAAPSGLSREDHYRFGMLLRQAVEQLGRRTVVVASGDLSHRLREDGPYGFAPEGPELDKALTGVMSSGDFGALFSLSPSLCERGAECGLTPFLMLAGALDGLAVRPSLYSYEGPFGVGYAVAAFPVEGADGERHFLDKRNAELAEEVVHRRTGEDAYVRLARETLEAFVRTGQRPDRPDGLPGEMTGYRAGVFVSIKKHGELRGCIGTVAPTRSCVADEIRFNAISSGTADHRFPPVRAEELPELTYTVDVLLPPEPATEDMLDPSRYGVIVSSGRRRNGLLLPNLEGVETVEQQLEIAKRKAGIEARHQVSIQRFEVERHT